MEWGGIDSKVYLDIGNYPEVSCCWRLLQLTKTQSCVAHMITFGILRLVS